MFSGMTEMLEGVYKAKDDQIHKRLIALYFHEKN